MIFAVIGTRPEVVKMAPVVAALRRRGIPTRVVATGQHDTWKMMGAFLESFQLEVDHQLTLHNRELLGSFIEITAGLGTLFAQHRPDLVLAVGDTTTVLAAAIAARKLGAGFGHVESGLRAFSRELPEEEHRICADALADLLFAPTRNAVDNLTREHVNGTVLLTGNPILDALRAQKIEPAAERHGILVTLHRQETVDRPERLIQVIAALDRIGRDRPIEWPLHPRTRAKIEAAGLTLPASIEVSEPLGHREFLTKLASTSLVITDSGGVQEESAILGTPCLTVRENTERPETIEAGVGILAGVETASILAGAKEIFASYASFARPVPHLYGDGRAGEKIAQTCSDWLARDQALVDVRAS